MLGNDQKREREKAALADRRIVECGTSAWGMAFFVLGWVGGVFLGIGAIFYIEQDIPEYGVPMLVAAFALIFGGFITKSLFHWAAELLKSQGRSEDLLREIRDKIH